MEPPDPEHPSPSLVPLRRQHLHQARAAEDMRQGWERLHRDPGRMSDWLAILDRLDRLMSEHMAWEEENLFPLLLSGLPEAAALIGGLCEDHRELAGLLRALRQQSIAGSEPGRIQQLGVLSRDLIDLMRFHREREDRAAWPMAVRLLDRQDWDRLMAALPTST